MCLRTTGACFRTAVVCFRTAGECFRREIRSTEDGMSTDLRSTWPSVVSFAVTAETSEWLYQWHRGVREETKHVRLYTARLA